MKKTTRHLAISCTYRRGIDYLSLVAGRVRNLTKMLLYIRSKEYRKNLPETNSNDERERVRLCMALAAMLSIWGMDPDWLVLIRSSPCILPKKKKKKTKKTKKRTNKKYTTPTPEWVCLSVYGEIDSFSAHTKWKTSPTRWFSPAAADGAAVANRWSLSVCYSCRSLKFFSWRSASTEEVSCNKTPSSFTNFYITFYSYQYTVCVRVCVSVCRIISETIQSVKSGHFQCDWQFQRAKKIHLIPHEFELLNEKREGQNLYFAKKEIKQLVCVCWAGPMFFRLNGSLMSSSPKMLSSFTAVSRTAGLLFAISIVLLLPHACVANGKDQVRTSRHSATNQKWIETKLILCVCVNLIKSKSGGWVGSSR